MSPQEANNLAVGLLGRGAYAQAIEALEHALRLRPGYAKALNNMGLALAGSGDFYAARREFEAAIAADAAYAAPHRNLSKLLFDHCFYVEAEAAARAASRIDPSDDAALNGLAMTLAAQRRLGESIDSFRAALSLKPSPAVHSNLLTHLHYAQELTPAQIAAEHREWAARYARGPRQAHHRNRDPNRRLRVALLSPDLHAHPVGRFLLPLLRHRDRAAVEICCYSDSRLEDSVAAELRSLADVWNVTANWPNEQLADRLHIDAIDIAIDLAGHTAGNRLLALAGKPAPMQMTYLGYPNTTGIAAIDFRITDAIADPPGENDDLYAEQLVRLPTCAWCWHVPADAPHVSPLPAAEVGYVTFGSLNNVKKISPTTVALWSAALQSTPNSRMLIKAYGITQPPTRQRLLHDFATHGIDTSRIDLLEQVHNYADHLQAYVKIDIALDTFPYHGTTTTCEALSIGVPVITLAGNAHVSRVSASLLTAAGLPHLIAADREQYAQIAASLAGDVPALINRRANLRSQLAGSALCDASRFASDFVRALQEAWRDWVSRVDRRATRM